MYIVSAQALTRAEPRDEGNGHFLEVLATLKVGILYNQQVQA
jgi:hypothetical protein